MSAKYLSILMISLMGTLAACQTTQQAQKQEVNVQQDAQQNPQQTLQAYTWSYQPKNSQKPIVLTFKGNYLAIDAGCNRMGTAVDLQNQTLVTAMLVSTQMACDGLMEQEQFTAHLFNQKTLTFSLSQTETEQPTLNLTTATGEQYQFIGTATPETKYQGQAETIFLEIAPETRACVGVAATQCLQVREIKYDAQGIKTSTGNWELFHDTIEGYTHQPNQRVILRLKRFTLKNPAADQSKYAYVKDMTVEQELIQ